MALPSNDPPTKLPLYGRPVAFGFPYHGKIFYDVSSWKLLLTSNSQEIDWPNAATGARETGSNLLLAQGANAVAMSTPLDAENGWVWKDRHLLSVGTEPSGQREWVLTDSAGQCWVLVANPEFDGFRVRFTVSIQSRFGALPIADYCMPESVVVGTTTYADLSSWSGLGFGGIAGFFAVFDQSPTGRDVLIGLQASDINFRNEKPIIAVLKLTISGTVDCATGAGLSAALSIWKTPADCAPADIDNSVAAQNYRLSADYTTSTTCSATSCGPGVTIVQTDTYNETPSKVSVGGVDLFFWDVAEGSWGSAFERVFAVNAYYDEDGAPHLVVADIDSSESRTQSITWTSSRSLTSELTSVCDTLSASGSATDTITKGFDASSSASLTETTVIKDNGITRATSVLSASQSSTQTWTENGTEVTNTTYDDTDFNSVCVPNSDSGTIGATRPDSAFLPITVLTDTTTLTVDGTQIYNGTWAGFHGSSSTASWGSTILGPPAIRLTNRLTGFEIDDTSPTDKYLGVNTDRAKRTGYADAYVSYDPYTGDIETDSDNPINFV